MPKNVNFQENADNKHICNRVLINHVNGYAYESEYVKRIGCKSTPLKQSQNNIEIYNNCSFLIFTIHNNGFIDEETDELRNELHTNEKTNRQGIDSINMLPCVEFYQIT